MYRIRSIVLAGLAGVACACSSNSTTPASPSQTVTVTRVDVVGTPPSMGTSSQFTALATRSDNTTSPVTAQATWRSSNEAAATVTPDGAVTARGPGSVQISAVYTGVTGSLTFTVAPASTLGITGTITDATSARPVASATVTITGATSRVTTVDVNGRYSLTGLPGGTTSTYTITVTAQGYITASRTLTAPAETTTVTQNFALAGGTGCPALGFDDLTVHLAPVTTSSMCGFTLRPTTTNWIVWTSYGRPAPSIVFMGPLGATTTGEVVVTSASGLPFRFESVDIYSSVTPIPYVITGIRNSTAVFTMQATQPNTFGNFVTISNSQPSTVIDSLVIRLTNTVPPTCCGDNPMGIDNVRLIQ